MTERKHGRLGELQNHHFTSWLQYPEHLLQSLFQVFEVSHPKGNDERIEFIFLKGKFFGVAELKRDPGIEAPLARG